MVAAGAAVLSWRRACAAEDAILGIAGALGAALDRQRDQAATAAAEQLAQATAVAEAQRTELLETRREVSLAALRSQAAADNALRAIEEMREAIVNDLKMGRDGEAIRAVTAAPGGTAGVRAAIREYELRNMPPLRLSPRPAPSPVGSAVEAG